MQNIREHVDINQVIDIANSLYYEFKDKDFREHAKKTKKALKRKEEGEEEEGFFSNIRNNFTKFFD